MRIIKSSYAQSMHDTCAELTKDEIECWRGRQITSYLKACIYAVSARVVAVVFNALWVVQESVRFFPRMVSLAVGLATSEKAGMTTLFLGRIIKIYGLALKNTVAQAALAVGGILIPEVVYYKYELQKSLFSLGLNALIETMPEFPKVTKKSRATFPPVDSLVQLYRRLGLTNEQFREQLNNALTSHFERDPKISSKLLSPGSDLFQRAFFQVLFTMVVKELNFRQEQGTFSQVFVRELNPIIWLPIINLLQPQTQNQLFQHLPQLESDLQNDQDYALAFERVTGYRYRSPINTIACNHLLEKMKAANSKLREEKIFTADSITEMEGPAFNAVISLGILNFVDEAHYSADPSPAITITSASGQKIAFKKPDQFFASQPQLVKLKQELLKLNFGQQKALFERCCCSEEDVKKAHGKLHVLFEDPAVVSCFNLVVSLKHGVVERKMNTERLRPEDTTPWAQAFSC